MKTLKTEFFKILNSLDNLEGAHYWYNDSCNDPYSQEKYQPISAKYELYLIVGNQEILLESAAFIKSNHEAKKEELIKKFSSWVRQWKTQKTPIF